MESVVNHPGVRRHLRRQTVEDHGIVSTHVRPGHHARLVNVSAGGALIETSHRLLPGTAVELHMEAKDGRTTVRGRVLRCCVVKLRPHSVCYRGAIAFDCHLPWLREDIGYSVPGEERRPGRPQRADPTQDVI